MNLNIKTFKIKISKIEREALMIKGKYDDNSIYRIVIGEGNILRRPTSYEYQKIYKKLGKEEAHENR